MSDGLTVEPRNMGGPFYSNAEGAVDIRAPILGNGSSDDDATRNTKPSCFSKALAWPYRVVVGVGSVLGAGELPDTA